MRDFRIEPILLYNPPPTPRRRRCTGKKNNVDMKIQLHNILLVLIAGLLINITVKTPEPAKSVATSGYQIVTAEVVSRGTVGAYGHAQRGYMLRTPTGLKFVPDGGMNLPENVKAVFLTTYPNGNSEITGTFYYESQL